MKRSRLSSGKLDINISRYFPSANPEGQYKTPPKMEGDGASIKAVISGLVNNGEEVIIVMHSYGGCPGTEATEVLAKADHQKPGKEGGVVALVYVAGWIPPIEKSIFELADDLLKGEYTYITPGDFYQYLFPEHPEEEAMKYTAQLENHSTACCYGILTYPGYSISQPLV